MAYRAGARCINMQFVQFHPTTLFVGEERFLISESMRGEGARLVDGRGREFMRDYHLEGSLAPRDVVARGIHQMMHETGDPCAYLDITHKPRRLDPRALPAHLRTLPRGGHRHHGAADPGRARGAL